MIQRIQTIYLLLAAIFMAVAAFSPIITLNEGDTLFSYGILNPENETIKMTWGIVSMAVLSAILAFVSVFLYKKRKRQQKLILVSVGVIVFYFITAAVYLISYFGNLSEVITAPCYGLIFPILALILLFLANKAIGHDEKLVRSTERIR